MSESFFAPIGFILFMFFVCGLAVGIIALIGSVVHTIWETKSDTNEIRHIKCSLDNLRLDFADFAEWVKSEDVDIDEAAEATK